MADSNDDIIELTQVADEKTPQEDQEILELTQVVEDQDEVVALEDGSTLVGDVMETASDAGPSSPAIVSDESGPDFSGPDFSGMAVEQLDAAIERVVEKKFSQQIEQILFEVTERVIKKEIAEIKAGLQRDLDDIDNA